MEQRLIDATLEEMKLHSLKFTMDDLTRRLHISKTSLYKMTKSKEQLIAAIIDYIIAEFKTKEAIILQTKQSIPEKILAIVKIYTDISVIRQLYICIQAFSILSDLPVLQFCIRI